VRVAKNRDDFRALDVVVTMLPTGALIIDMSSSEPEGPRALGAERQPLIAIACFN
jgi:3-hydroxyisobutyrate dehydrogenase-like beta-hydroxyacid dehydrogenase